MSQPKYEQESDRRINYEAEIDSIKSLLRQVQNVQSDESYCLMEHSDHTFTHSDIEWVIDQLGYRPTRPMWEEAGIKFIDTMYVGQGPDGLY